MESELAKLNEQQKKLNQKKRKARAKEYERLGRAFYQKAHAKSFTTAHNILEHVPMFDQGEKTVGLSTQQTQELVRIADQMHWNGNFWQIEDLKDVSQWLAQFRTENQDK